MSTSEIQGIPTKYAYKFRFEPVSLESRAKQEELSERDIQSCIDEILGVDSKRYAAKRPEFAEITR